VNKGLLLNEKKELKAKIASQQLQLNQLYKLINGFKSERFISAAINEAQTTLFTDLDSKEAPKSTETVNYTRTKKKHPGRKTLPEHLPVKEVIIEPLENTEGLTKIGEEISETLEYTTASLVKRRTIRSK